MLPRIFTIYFFILYAFQFGVSQTVITENGELKNSAEVLPYLIQCEDQADRKKCTNQEISIYISKNLKYPALSRENGMEGTLLISFVVNKEGHVEQGKVLHAFDRYISKDADVLFKKMEADLNWIPGKMDNKNVSVLYNLPLHFHVLKKPIRKLTSFDEIICERGSSYNSFNIKAKKLEKIFSSTNAIETLWFYDLQQIEFISLDIQILTKGETLNIESINYISKETLNKILAIKKGSTINFTIKEQKNEGVRVIEKTVFIN